MGETNQSSTNLNQPINPVSTLSAQTTLIGKNEQKKGKKKILIGLSILLITVVAFVVCSVIISALEGVPNGIPFSTLKSYEINPTPTPDSTIDWNTYTNTEYGYSFKYPKSFTVNPKDNKVLEKDVESVIGGGFEGGNVLKKGAVFSTTIFKNKDLSDSALRDEYGTGVDIKNVKVSGKDGTQVTLPNSYEKKIYVALENENVLFISLQLGFEATKDFQMESAKEADQILTTFKFTSQNQITDADTPGVTKYGVFESGVLAYKFTYKYPETIKEDLGASPYGSGVFYPIEADIAKDASGTKRVLEVVYSPKSEKNIEQFDKEKNKPTTRQITINGYPAIRYQSNLYENQVPVKTLDNIVINKNGELVTLSNWKATEEKWKNLLDLIIPTFKFLN